MSGDRYSQMVGHLLRAGSRQESRYLVFTYNIPFDGKPASVGNGGMVAFAAPSPDVVDAAYKAALAAGAKDEGAPGERKYHGIGYYGAYFRDLDGNKVHVEHRGDVESVSMD